MTEETISHLIREHDANRWTSRDGSKQRLYINGWAELIGLGVDRYKTGNISSATFEGERVSNREAGRIMGLIGDVWIDLATDQIHVDHTPGRSSRYYDAETIAEMIQAALTDLIGGTQ